MQYGFGGWCFQGLSNSVASEDAAPSNFHPSPHLSHYLGRFTHVCLSLGTKEYIPPPRVICRLTKVMRFFLNLENLHNRMEYMFHILKMQIFKI